MGILMYQSMPAVIHLKNQLPQAALGSNAFNHPCQFQVFYVFSPPALLPVVLFTLFAEHIIGQFLTSDLCCTLLDGSSLA